MAKTSGLGQRLLFGGYDLSGDTQSYEVDGGAELLEVTGIDKSGKERIGALRDGSLKWTSFFNPAVGQAHPVLSVLPTTDVQVAVLAGTTIGDPGCSLIGRQPDYAGKRATNGMFTFDLSVVGDGYGLEWGQQLTAGIRTDTTATNGASLDLAASASFGAQAHLQVTAVTGTSVTVGIEDSADNATFAAVTGLAFTAATTRATQRLATANTATVRRYVRAVTTGTFTSASFSVILARNEIAGQAF